jgi:steroid delta-isomerase-like uncharacterized protein
MNRDDVRSIAEEFIQAWSAGGSIVLDRLAHPDIVVQYTHYPQPYIGIEQFRTHQTVACFPDLRITATDVIVEGDRAVVRWTYAGTHRACELFGVAPSGKTVQVPGITVYEIRDGKVHRESGIVDVFQHDAAVARRRIFVTALRLGTR